MNNRLVELQKKLRDALLSGQYTKAAKLQKQIQIEKSRRELVPLKNLLPGMTPEETEDSLMKMHKVFVMADMLYGFAIEFEQTVQKYDPTMQLLIVNKVREIGKLSRDITKNVDDFHCQHLSENFGNMCDECGLVIENIIYTYRQREKKLFEEEQKKKVS